MGISDNHTSANLILEKGIKAMPFNDSFRQVSTLETPRLHLRPFTYADLPSYMAFFTDPDVQRWLGGIMIPKDEKWQRQWTTSMAGA